MKKRNKIIIALMIIFVVIASFSVLVFKFNLIDKFKFLTASLLEELNNEPDKIYETLTDEEGNEIVVEMEKVIVIDEEGNKVALYEDSLDQINIFYYKYFGTIEKIEDNKIYFLVDKECNSVSENPKNVDDYIKIFDINTFDLEGDPLVQYSVEDSLWYEDKRLFSADELNSYIGNYVNIHYTKWKDPRILKTYKSIDIYNS